MYSLFRPVRRYKVQMQKNSPSHMPFQRPAGRFVQTGIRRQGHYTRPALKLQCGAGAIFRCFITMYRFFRRFSAGGAGCRPALPQLCAPAVPVGKRAHRPGTPLRRAACSIFSSSVNGECLALCARALMRAILLSVILRTSFPISCSAVLYHEAKRNGIIAHPEAVAGLAQPERRAVAQKQYNSRVCGYYTMKRKRMVPPHGTRTDHSFCEPKCCTFFGKDV